ncbi:MAG: hypothetical protein E7243_04350 [Lacrimispora celerecrescens]|nr:hypothetical protein [Lacrimispora celerecrescens]
MILTKESIDTVKLTRRFSKCYDAREVDLLLDEIAAAADEQCRELEQLRSVQAEYMEMKSQISEALLIGQKAAADLMEQTKQECAHELEVLHKKKTVLQEEISSLERYKILAFQRIKNEIGKLLGDPEYAETPPQYEIEKNETDGPGNLPEEIECK